MKSKMAIFFIVFIVIPYNSCRQQEKPTEINIIFLHHSIGDIIWNGTTPSFITKVAKKISKKLARRISRKAELPLLFTKYNEENGKNYSIRDMVFPKSVPYGWKNFPFDYYNIWIKNEGSEPFMEEPTLEMLTKEYQVIIFKHCFPVSNIESDQDSADINSDVKTISNYKLQYIALRDKLHQFQNTKFILFTGAAQVKSNIPIDEATRAREFFNWVTGDWDLPLDNIFLWDMYRLQTEGDIYFRNEYALSVNNSHPNKDFAERVVKLLFNRIIDVIENDGGRTMLTGEKKY